jgi:hypothetical protein
LIATSINNIEDPLERVGVASKVFGGVGKTVLNLADNLGTAENRFNELGLTIDDAAIARGVKLKNLNNELSRSWDKLTSQMSGLFGPVIEGWTMMLSDFAEKISEAAGGALLFAENLGLVARNQAAINGATDAEFRNFMENQQRSNRSRIVRKRLKVDDGKGGEQFLIDKQIASQRQLIEALKNQSNKLAPIPQALLKGSSAQIDFVAQLQRQNQQAKIDQREKKKIDIAEKQLKKLEEIKKQRDEEFKDRKTISIL